MNKKALVMRLLKVILFILPLVIICLCFISPYRSGKWLFSFFLIFCIAERSWEAFYTTKKQGRIIKEIDPTLPVTVLLYILLIIFCICEFYLTNRKLNLFVSYFAVVIYMLALALRLWSVSSLGNQWSINILDKSNDDFQKKLITKGPYKYIRHPIYLGTILEQLSIPLIAGLYYSAFVIWAISVPFHIIKVAAEEKNLILELGSDYEKYIENKSRFSPFKMLLKRG